MKKIPKIILIWTILFIFSTLVLTGLLVFQLIFAIKILDYYIILLCLVASIGLLITSVSSIIEYKRKTGASN